MYYFVATNILFFEILFPSLKIVFHSIKIILRSLEINLEQILYIICRGTKYYFEERIIISRERDVYFGETNYYFEGTNYYI